MIIFRAKLVGFRVALAVQHDCFNPNFLFLASPPQTNEAYLLVLVASYSSCVLLYYCAAVCYNTLAWAFRSRLRCTVRYASLFSSRTWGPPRSLSVPARTACGTRTSPSPSHDPVFFVTEGVITFNNFPLTTLKTAHTLRFGNKVAGIRSL